MKKVLIWIGIILVALVVLMTIVIAGTKSGSTAFEKGMNQGKQAVQGSK